MYMLEEKKADCSDTDIRIFSLLLWNLPFHSSHIFSSAGHTSAWFPTSCSSPATSSVCNQP